MRPVRSLLSALLAASILAVAPAHAAAAPTLTIRSVRTPVVVGDHAEAYGLLTGIPGTPFALTGSYTWDGVTPANGTTVASSRFSSIFGGSQQQLQAIGG